MRLEDNREKKVHRKILCKVFSWNMLSQLCMVDFFWMELDVDVKIGKKGVCRPILRF